MYVDLVPFKFPTQWSVLETKMPMIVKWLTNHHILKGEIANHNLTNEGKFHFWRLLFTSHCKNLQHHISFYIMGILRGSISISQGSCQNLQHRITFQIGFHGNFEGLFFDFPGLILHFRGEMALSPPCILPPPPPDILFVLTLLRMLPLGLMELLLLEIHLLQHYLILLQDQAGLLLQLRQPGGEWERWEDKRGKKWRWKIKGWRNERKWGMNERTNMSKFDYKQIHIKANV